MQECTRKFIRRVRIRQLRTTTAPSLPPSLPAPASTAQPHLRVAACEVLQGVGDGAAIQVLVAPAVDLGVRLLEQHHPGLVPLGTVRVERLSVWCARYAVVDCDQLPFPVLEEAESVDALLRVLGRGEEVEEEVAARRDTCDGTEEPAVAKRPLHNVTGVCTIHEKSRCFLVAGDKWDKF